MLKVLKPGFYTTLQDQGRFGHRNKGVPVSGVMDAYSAANANAMLENDPNDAVLEITMTGPVLEFTEETTICLTGALMSPELNGQSVNNLEIIQVKTGDVLSFGTLVKGLRTYLGIKGGFLLDEVLGSRSYYHPVTEHKCITENMQLAYVPHPDFTPKLIQAKMDNFLDEFILEATKGPEFDLLGKKEAGLPFSKEFTISKENNRMGYQLNEKLSVHTKSMLTSATLPGTVQLTPSGRIIILMKDGQTTGGYPRVLNLTPAAINILAQKRMGDKIKFALLQ
ncbi:biotin-dependent carboxyltransferase family protein [Allomuricauda sp. d1]|uniref:5-oxoprolinase subunit C family protein n=1 Tax=Allomuricauda sp. d1 TaxID=3136725 RepID=UPI0031D38132